MKETRNLARCSAPDGSLMVLQEHDSEFFMKVDGVTLMSTIATASEQLMAELACEGTPRRVLIGGLGFGFTLRKVLELCGTDVEVEVAELLPEVVAWNREFLGEVNGSLLDDPRVKVYVGDVKESIDRASGGKFDAVMLDVDNGPDSLVHRDNDKLYGRRGFRRVKSALSAGGRVVYWSANRDKGFERELAKEFVNVHSVGAKAYPAAKKFSHTLFIADRG
ncbi:spermine synthase [Haloferula sp.]|uniref:spermine/spermidine synthase domain-containing protein n=1 Tax=Haloferula sp. TaxID=2497595 RepID=UPI00329B8832